MKALVSELKIMVHLGQHLNVVNLLGAVTKNIVKRKIIFVKLCSSKCIIYFVSRRTYGHCRIL